MRLEEMPKTNKEWIYKMLKESPKKNFELATVSLRYGEYIRQLRQDGYKIKVTRLTRGVSLYEMEQE